MPILSPGCYLNFKQNGSQNLGKSSWPTRLLIYCKKILENNNQQAEEQIPWAKLGERAQNFHCHYRCATFPNPHVFTIMKFLQSLSLSVFMEASLHRQGWLNHCHCWLIQPQAPSVFRNSGQEIKYYSMHLSLKKFQGFWKMWVRNCG